MALSRIWAAFIIIAIIAASVQYFSSGGKDIHSRMVVGKSGDTTKTKILDSSSLSPEVISALNTSKEYKSGNTKIIRTADNRILSYREQNADGIIATCKTAVE